MIDVDNIIPVINEKPVTHCLYPQFGTIGFRKPLKNGKISFEDDFWSLGATIYNLYSNKVPYQNFINNTLNMGNNPQPLSSADISSNVTNLLTTSVLTVLPPGDKNLIFLFLILSFVA